MSRRSSFNDSIVYVDDLEAGNVTTSNRSGTANFDRKYFRTLSNDSFVVTGAGHVPTASSSSVNNGDESEHENASVWSSRHFRSNRTFLAMASSGINFDMDNDDEDIPDECPPVDEKASSVPISTTIPGTNSKFSAEKFTSAVLYGVINSILTIPFTYGYAAIIFSHPDFATFMPSLSKLVMLSSVVHQVMFTLLSSLPFAIGQVQDAGLIFLSAMATSICNSLGPDVSLEAKVTTVVVTIGIATAALGMCLVLIGRFKLAGLASYVPMPVIGGYLAYIGLFCFYAGLSLSTGFVIDDLTSLRQIADLTNISLCVPGIIGGTLLIVVAQRCKNSFVLPVCILALPIAFYVLLPIVDMNMDEARDAGLVSPYTPPSDLKQMLDLFDFTQVHWSQMPKQITTWLAMAFVVAFSSCLDVAAIEMEMGQQLDTNHELSSVGWSNVVSGLCGGYTGSYIFSQTIFTYRSKTNSRVVGVCVILAELLVVLLPVSVMSLLPRFFFAATLIFIAIDFTVEWLVLVYKKVSFREYVVLWLSFIAINCVSLELGMLLGVGFAILNFLFSYVLSMRFVTRKPRKSSAAVRKYAARAVINQKRDAIVYLELCGHLFFGSSAQILRDAQREIVVRKKSSVSGDTGTNIWDWPSRYLSILCGRLSGHFGRRSHQRSSILVPTPVATRTSGMVLECLDGSRPAALNGQQPRLPTQFVVMDFGRVSGLDATAARSSLLILQQICSRHGILVLFADVLPQIHTLLIDNEIADSNNATSFFPSGNAALEWCENQLLEPTSLAVNKDALTAHVSMSVLLHRFRGESDASSYLQGVDHFFKQHSVSAGHAFYHIQEYPDRFYFLATGRIALLMNSDGSSLSSSEPLVMQTSVLPGAMFGEVDFFGRQCRRTTAVATELSVVFEISRSEYEAMEKQAPELTSRLRDVMLQSLALAIANTMTLNSLNCAPAPEDSESVPLLIQE